MAKVGRKAKPTALKLINGNPGKRPINEDEPQPNLVYDPQPPETLNELERVKWTEMVSKLSAARVLTEMDLDALEIYCREWCNYHAALRDIDRRGKLVQTPTGGVMWNPSWTQYKHSQSVCRSIMAEFGMTPSTRTGVHAVGDKDGKHEWREFV